MCGTLRLCSDSLAIVDHEGERRFPLSSIRSLAARRRDAFVDIEIQAGDETVSVAHIPAGAGVDAVVNSLAKSAFPS